MEQEAPGAPCSAISGLRISPTEIPPRCCSAGAPGGPGHTATLLLFPVHSWGSVCVSLGGAVGELLSLSPVIPLRIPHVCESHLCTRSLPQHPTALQAPPPPTGQQPSQETGHQPCLCPGAQCAVLMSDTPVCSDFNLHPRGGEEALLPSNHYLLQFQTSCQEFRPAALLRAAKVEMTGSFFLKC